MQPPSRRASADALSGGEVALGVADVEALAVVVEQDGDVSGVAEVALDGLDRDGVEGALDPALIGTDSRQLGL